MYIFMSYEKIEFEIEKSKDNFNILKVKKDNRWIYIGSKYNMRGQIDKFLNEFSGVDEKNILIIFGLGAGDHIKELRNKFKNNKIIVLDPIENLKEAVNYDGWMDRDKNLFVVCGESNSFMETLSEHLGDYNLDYTKIVYFSRYNDIFADEVKELLLLIRNFYTGLLISRNTQMKYNRKWFELFISNLKYILSGDPIDEYKDKYKNIPAIVVSAGPSLEKNIDELKKLNGEMIVLTAARTLDVILRKNIKFNFLVVIDPQDNTYKLIEKNIDKINEKLLFYQYTNAEVVKNHKGGKIYYLDDIGISKNLNKKTDELFSGGSVAHTMTDFARYLGCNPIVYIGQDLAYTGEKSYSSFSENLDGTWKYDDVKSSDDIWVESVDDDKVRTSIVYNLFREKIEKLVEAYSDRIFINATEGGARIKGTVEMKLSDVIERYRDTKIKVCEELADTRDDEEMEREYQKSLSDIMKYLNKLEEECSEALSNVDKLKKLDIKNDNYKINKIFKKLNRIDDNFKESLIGVLLKPIFWHIMRESAKKDEEYTLEDIINENSILYGTILKEIKFAKEVVEKQIHK